MIINYIHKILWFAGLILLQVLILNNLHVAGYATPFLYIYFIIRFESGVSRNALMLWAFALGLFIDMFSNTPGVNAAATVLLAFVRPFYLRLFTPREDQDIIVPSLKSLGVSSYLKYLVAAVFTHHLILFMILFFSFADIQILLIKIVGSTLLTICCIMGIEGMRK